MKYTILAGNKTVVQKDLNACRIMDPNMKVLSLGHYGSGFTALVEAKEEFVSTVGKPTNKKRQGPLVLDKKKGI